MAEGQIRVIALGLFVHPADGTVLALRFDDAIRDVVFYRPPGGGVEFGETAEAAMARELREEVGYPARVLRLAGTGDNIFEVQGRKHHEVVFNWLVEFEDETLYRRTEFDIVEDNGQRYVAHWVDPDHLAAEGIYFFPKSTADLIRTLRT